jgi:hypothetical protein
MTEAATAATKAKTTNHAASSSSVPDYGISKFGMPKFDLPNMEMSEALREMTEKGVAHVKDTYATAKVATEEAADLLQNAYASISPHPNDEIKHGLCPHRPSRVFHDLEQVPHQGWRVAAITHRANGRALSPPAFCDPDRETAAQYGRPHHHLRPFERAPATSAVHLKADIRLHANIRPGGPCADLCNVANYCPGLLGSPSLCEAVALLAQAPYITFAVAPHVAENLCKLQRNFAREPFVAPIKTHLTPELASNYVFYNAGAAPAMRGGYDGRPA